jgi:hypothetical protein
MASSKPGYDPMRAAKTCYHDTARASRKANVPQGSGA